MISLLGLVALAALSAPHAQPEDRDFTNLSAEGMRRQRVEQRALESRLEISTAMDDDGDLLITLTASNTPVKRIIESIGREAGREVVGLDTIMRDPPLYSKLENRSLEDALLWIAGSAGLYVQVGQSSIKVAEDLPVYPTREDCYKRANTSLWRALLDHPRSSQAPRAAWTRANIESANLGRAIDSATAYDTLIEQYPDSDLVPEALLEAGKQYGLAGKWDYAIERFDSLARYRSAHEFGVEARWRLADAHTHLAELAKNPDVQIENARRALLVLDALDDSAPANDAFERRQRLMSRARAYSLRNDPMNALRSIDLAATYSAQGDRDPELMDLRANALDRAGQYHDAFLAWLQAAEYVEGAAKGEAYRRAAASANAEGAHIAAWATWKHAENMGLGKAVAEEQNRALVALGLEPEVSTVYGDRDKINQGERYLAGRRYQEAIDIMRPVFDRRFGLDRADRQRLALNYAQALERGKRLDEAIQALRTAAQESEYAGDREEIYKAASTLYERNQDIERAITALSGAL
ncbi:MAG: hypothetical protein R3F49_05300 [Planctomycetota bacterium]